MKSIIFFFYNALILLFLIQVSLAKSPETFHPYQWKLYTVQDSEESLPYETNGEGPLYHEEDARFQELGNKEPPHPDMPDEEPHVLLEMEEKMATLLGLPHSKHHRDNNRSFFDEVNAKTAAPHLIEQDFRFAQIATDSKLSAKDKAQLLSTTNNLHNEWDTVSFTGAWASSVYTYRFWWYYHSYPATNAINGWSYWCSTGGHSKDQVVTWQGDFDRIRRIANLWIRWAYAPGMMSVQTTTDGKTWEEKTAWRDAAKSRASQANKLFFWWWQFNARSYAESVVFDEPIWASSVRILMKDPVFYYFGIYQVKAWTKQWVVQLKSGQNMDSDECLNVNNGLMENAAQITVRNCIEAIEQGDGRELFVLQNNLQITSYNQDFCIESSNGELEESKTHIHLYNCRSISSNTNDNREKWLLDPKGYMKILKNPDKCLTIKGSEIEMQQNPSAVAKASSTMSDNQHEPKMAISGSEDGFWASEPGVEKVEFKVTFPASTIKEITIKLQYVAADFEVLCFLDGYWRSFANYKDQEESEVKVNVGSKYISGVRVMFMKAGESAKFNEKIIYGIKDIKIKTGSRAVNLKDCNSETDSQTNKWFVDDSNFVDVSVAPTYHHEFKRLYENTNRLLDTLHALMGWPPKIQLMIEKAKLIAESIYKIESEINSLDIKLEQFKSENLVEEEEAKKDSGLGNLGASSVRPALSCAYIKQLYPYKMTGYYWIQPECAKVPIRVFCDYTNSEYGLDYAYYGGLGDAKIDKPIKSIDDVRYYCGKLGLNPVSLKSKAQIELIHRYLVDIGVNTQSNGFIPLGYDYGCQKQDCSGKYNSLNSRTSPDVTDYLTSMIDTKNLLMQGFTKLFNGKSDYLIGFGLSKNGAMTSKFKSKVPIKGIVCSTNKEKSDDDSAWIKADCDTKPRGNSDFDGEINTNIKVVCPANCANTGTGKVTGTLIFTDDSSVCKAAIHNNQISSEKGGKVEVGIMEGRDNYVGSEANGVKSETLEQKWDRSFTISKYKVACPLDNYKNYKEISFLQSDENWDFNSLKNKATSAVSNIANKASSVANKAVDTAKNLASTAAGAANEAINTAKDAASNIVDKAKDTVDKGVNAVSSLLNGGESGGTEGNGGEGEAGTTTNEANTQKMGGEIDSTEQAIEKLLGLYDLDRDDLQKQVRLVKDSGALLEKLKSEFGPLINSDFSPDYQSKYIDSLSIHLKGTKIEMDKTIAIAEGKIKKKEKTKLKLKLEKMKYTLYEPYTEKYDGKIEDMYELHDLVQSNNKPSKWAFSKDALNGHATAIAQTSNIQINGDVKERAASVLKLKSKSFYDGRIAVSVLAKDTGTIGIAFRYLDQFNYYVFEMERGVGTTGFKRFRKFVNGEPTVLAFQADGGYLQDKWYRVVLEFEMGKFVVKMEEESEKNLNPDYEVEMTKVLEGYDGDFAKGGFAFTVNNMAGVYFDNFNVKPLNCVDEKKSNNLNVYLAPTCNRFKESFYTDLSYIWKPVDPENSKNGPSVWEYKRDYEGKNHAIVQNSLITGTDALKTPSLLELKIEKLCNKGLIQAEIYVEEAGGYVGVTFHYQNSNNYLVFELTADEKGVCQLRKKSDGTYSLLQKTEDTKRCGLQVKKWASLTIKLSATNWYFYLSKSDGEGMEEVLKVAPDNDLQHGSFGFAVYGMKAAFTNIRTMPEEDFQFNGLPSSEEPNQVGEEVAGNNGQGSNNDQQNNQKKGDNADKDAEFESCLEKKSPIEREKFCANKFSDDKAAQQDCKSNFCDRCCDDNIDSIHEVKRFKCKKSCKANSQNDKQSDEWELCIASPRPTVSVYQYCEASLEGQEQKKRCKIDFCNLCCAVSDLVFKKSFDEELVQRCHKNCMDNFADTTDISVPG